MKISTIRIGILFVLIISILIPGISIAANRTDGSYETKRVEFEQEEVILTLEEQETLDLINSYRKKNGLKELKPISKLQYVAELKAIDLVENKYFSHVSERLGTPFEMLERNNIEYMIAGENLAGITTPIRAVNGWIDSITHKENILEEKFEYTGICVIESPVYGKVFVQLFMGI